MSVKKSIALLFIQDSHLFSVFRCLSHSDSLFVITSTLRQYTTREYSRVSVRDQVSGNIDTLHIGS